MKKEALKIRALQLTLAFIYEEEIPARLRERDPGKKINWNTLIEKRFQRKVTDWENTIQTMKEKLNSEIVSRFINLSPTIDIFATKVVECHDFLLFTDYFIERREVVEHYEEGCLAHLYTEFQQRIEKELLNR